MKRSASITIHPEALQHNLNRARQVAPGTKINAVIKANAYGHGATETAGTLYQIADSFAVSCLPEAIELRQAGIDKPITVLQGHQTVDDLRIAEHYNFRLTIHDPQQLHLLDEYPGKSRFEINLKIDTGMHRLGFPPDQTFEIYNKLKSHVHVNPDKIILMTHLSCADERDNAYTNKQLSVFNEASMNIDSPKSIANSAGILGWKEAHADWVRPGIMLYGSSPFLDTDRDHHQLQAAMTLHAPVIALHDLKQGDCIGYGASWRCPINMRVAVIACGYADGYPRHAASGTPVWIKGQLAHLVGRVSMDMIIVDINNLVEGSIIIGDQAELWGENLSVDRIAQSAETISYELLCNAGNNCKQMGT